MKLSELKFAILDIWRDYGDIEVFVAGELCDFPLEKENLTISNNKLYIE